MASLQQSKRDFDALIDAHRGLVKHLHQDEKHAPLVAQLSENPGGAAHGYFCEPYVPEQLGLPVRDYQTRRLLNTCTRPLDVAASHKQALTAHRHKL